MELLSVANTAQLIGVSERRVRALIERGQLPAHRVLGRWGIFHDDAATFRTHSPGRPLSEVSAWAVLTRLAGTSPGGALPSRLEQRVAGLPDRADPIRTLRAWTANRAATIRVWADEGDIELLHKDARVVLGSGAALRGVPGRLRVYVEHGAVDQLRRTYRLSPREGSASTPLIIGVVGDLTRIPRSPVDGRLVAAPVAAIDLLDDGDSKPAAQLLNAAIGALAAAHREPSGAPVRANSWRRVHATPDRLDRLRGPNTGVVRLPVTLDWGPGRQYDLTDPDEERALYRQVIHEATSPADIERYLRYERLVELWPELGLQQEISARWEQQFPELALRTARA